MSGKNYVCRLQKAVCSCGSMENYLNVETDHGIIWEGACESKNASDAMHPLMNANDMNPKENIIHFGRCDSGENLGNKIDFEEIVMGRLIPGSLVIKHLTGCSNCKCKPVIIEAWTMADSSNLVEGAPSLTDESILFCRNGGIISIVKEEESGGGRGNH